GSRPGIASSSPTCRSGSRWSVDRHGTSITSSPSATRNATRSPRRSPISAWGPRCTTPSPCRISPCSAGRSAASPRPGAPPARWTGPAISYRASAAAAVAGVIRRGQPVVLESPTYPGTTQEILLPRFQARGLRAGEDFFLAFSPERIDPGNRRYTLREIPKVVGGLTPACRELAATLYARITRQVVPVSGPETAEMVKLFENTFRSVNIALVNEFAIMCRRLGISVWEVIGAA